MMIHARVSLRRLYTFLLCCALSYAATSASAQTAKREVFIFSGQSNMSAYGPMLQLAPVPTYAQTVANGWVGRPAQSSDTGIAYAHPTAKNLPSLFVYNNSGGTPYVYNYWGPYAEDAPKNTNGTLSEVSSFGPELSFLYNFQTDHPSTPLAAIKMAIGGTSLTQWLPGASQGYWDGLSLMISQAAARLDASDGPGNWEWAGFVWMQGENGAATVYPTLNPTPGAEYSDQLRQFLKDVRGITRPDLPVVIGRISDNMLAENIIEALATNGPQNTADQYRFATNYRRAQQVLVAGDTNNVISNMDTLPQWHSGDPQYWYHTTADGYLAMGERFYASYKLLANGPSPLAFMTATTLPPVTIGTLYSASIGATGGSGGYVYSATGLPTGLSFLANNSGLLSGTTSSPAGTYNATLTVTDSSGASVSAPFTVTVQAPSSSKLTVSANSISFGTQTMSTASGAQSITVTNTGQAAVTLSGVYSTGANYADFVVGGNCVGSLAAGASCTVSAVFTPSAVASESSSILITGNAANTPLSIPLTGVGAAAGAPVITVNPTSVPFGSQATGTTNSLAVTVSNTGTASLTLSGFALSGTNASDFTQANNCPSSLATSNSCTVTLTFKPTVVASEVATLTVTGNASNSPITVALSGTGTKPPAPTAILSTSSLAFSAQTQNTTSTAQNVTLSNTGNAALAISSIAMSGGSAADFATTSNCGSSLAANASCTIAITFTPSTTGLEYAMVTVTDNASPTTQTISLSGTGQKVATPTAVLSASSITFPAQTLNTTSAAQTVTLSNTGNAALAISSIAMSGGSAADFSTTSNCGSSLAANSSCTLSITFTPTTANLEYAMVTVTDNASPTTQAVSLSGTGQKAAAPTAVLSASALSFSQTQNTTSAAQVVTLSNTGTAALSISSIALSGGNAADFSATSSCGSTLAANTACTIAVTFTPSTTGLEYGMVTVTDNASPTTQAISLSGTGQKPATPTAVLSAGALTFASQTLATKSATQAVTLSNTGTAALSISSIGASGLNAADFPFSTTCGSSLAAGASCSITVAFNPATTAAESAAITVVDNASPTTQTLSLSGTGVAAASSAQTVPSAMVENDVEIDNLYSAAWNNFNGTTLHGTTMDAYVSAGVTYAPILSFSNIAVPAGMHVTSATLTITAVSWYSTAGMAGSYLTVPVDPTSTKMGWSYYAANAPWTIPGGLSDTVPNAQFTTGPLKGVGDQQVTMTLDPTVVNNLVSSGQLSFIFQGLTPTIRNSIYSGQSAVPAAKRPVLTLQFGF